MTANDFLPSDYTQPTPPSQYMKFKEGENKFRILSKPIIGWEDWTPEKKPIRFPMENKPDHPIVPKKAIKHFWAMIVYNYQEKAINILEITQATIQAAITNLIKDSDWGAPYDYDIKVNRTGQGMEDTEYAVSPSPKKPINEDIIFMFRSTPCQLDKLFSGADPFDCTTGDKLQASDLDI